MSKNVSPITKDAPKTPARMLSPFEEMERMFEQFLHRDMMTPFEWHTPAWSRLSAPFAGKLPKVDVVDRDNEIVIRAELPGVDRKDVDVSLGTNTVTIKGSSKREEKEEKGDYYRCEISRGDFSRTLALPGDVDSSKAKAVFKDGILELTVPKLEKSQKHNIRIE
jgi:HSP20 family protein